MIALGIDQGDRSGWGICVDRRIVASGVATNWRERLAVLELIESRNGGTLKGVFVMFEDHSGIPLTRLTTADHVTERRGRRGAPERSTGSILGQGSNKGRWLEQLEMHGHPKAHRDKVKPHVWRNAVGIRGRASHDDTKRAACQLASSMRGKPIDDHDHAEGVLIAYYAGTAGLMRDQVRKVEARAEAKGKRELKRQGDLFGSLK